MKKLIFLFIVFFSSHTQADQLLRNGTVSTVFYESDRIAGFYLNQGFSDCLDEIMYIRLADEGGEVMFSMVLTAKDADQGIQVIFFEYESDGTCTVKGIHLR